MKIGGLDEVGWGALAGPVISVVAVFDEKSLSLFPHGVKDSKKTTTSQREGLFLPLCRLALDVGIGHAWPWEMDQYGPFPSLQLSYRRAVESLSVKPDLLIVDGSNRIEAWPGKQRVEPKADVNHPQVSAASIIAKHFRDTIMRDYERSRKLRGLPTYGWDENAGYGTLDHVNAIHRNGLLVDGQDKTPDHSLYVHRLRYCRKILAKKESGTMSERNDGPRT